jgi:hypothetical protein
MTQHPKFSFWWMKVTAWKNYKVLQSYDMDIGRVLAAQPFSNWQWDQSSNPCRF